MSISKFVVGPAVLNFIHPLGEEFSESISRCSLKHFTITAIGVGIVTPFPGTEIFLHNGHLLWSKSKNKRKTAPSGVDDAACRAGLQLYDVRISFPRLRGT